jgi:hypothetical protein
MNEQNEERLSTADIAASAERSRDERISQATDSSTKYDQNLTDRGATADTSSERDRAPLFPTTQSDEFRNRWTTIQSGFVDEPRSAVQQADTLIAEVMNALATSFSNERQQLEQQWDRGGDVSTEDLRLGLQRYRSFFDRLLSV